MKPSSLPTYVKLLQSSELSKLSSALYSWGYVDHHQIRAAVKREYRSKNISNPVAQVLNILLNDILPLVTSKIYFSLNR